MIKKFHEKKKHFGENMFGARYFRKEFNLIQIYLNQHIWHNIGNNLLESDLVIGDYCVKEERQSETLYDNFVEIG